MPRKLRLEYSGEKYHIISRGNYREPIFAEEGSKKAFLGCLWEACEKWNWIVQG
ncbi:MAG TPA: hypothetical protein VKC60_04320 [Opitutaceae bacterium]|nr:hypothetical protein [Opitutaceae bacterium]